MRSTSKNTFEKFYEIARRIPAGKVATYGQIAALAGSPRGARMVGWALHVLTGERLRSVPWHRVLNREGRISTTCAEHTADEQAYLLRREGVRVETKNGYVVDLAVCQWNGRNK